MSWQTVGLGSRTRRWPWRSWYIVAALMLGLALVVAACATTSPIAGQPTATVGPTATPTLAPGTCTTWRIVPSPDPTPRSYLRAVSALSPTQAWAVGGSGILGFNPVIQALAEQWDGTAWHAVPVPGVYPLNGVAAVSPNDVWAVGGVPANPQIQHPLTLIVHWNGTQWSQVTSPNPSPMAGDISGNTLYAIVARAANDVWAVGSYDTAQDGMQTMTLHWDGTAWAVVSSPTLTGNTAGAFNAVASVPGTNQLWAVGYRFVRTPPYPMQTLIERWDGTVWQIIPNPTLPSNLSEIQLTGVVALSATDAWAVGYYNVLQTNPTTPLIMHWDGTAWTIVPGASTTGHFSGVAAAGPKDVQVVGFNMPNGTWNQYQPETWLVERWDGMAWQIVNTPTPTWLLTGDVPGITVDKAGGYWAVGTYLNLPDVYPPDSYYQTLTERCP